MNKELSDNELQARVDRLRLELEIEVYTFLIHNIRPFNDRVERDGIDGVGMQYADHVLRCAMVPFGGFAED